MSDGSNVLDFAEWKDRILAQRAAAEKPKPVCPSYGWLYGDSNDLAWSTSPMPPMSLQDFHMYEHLNWQEPD